MPDRIYSPSLKRIAITKIIPIHIERKTFFNNFWCNIILNISMTRTFIFLWWIEIGLLFFISLGNGNHLSPYVFLNACLCKEFILLLTLFCYCFYLFCDGIVIGINTYSVICWERYIAFATTVFHLAKGKPLTKNFGKVLDFF